ncbi:MAG: pyrimidine 5'-nucleotidase [Anaerolineae bacterium]|nr:pyrimidine 5'-nucleotidase [Anaerolineae bacterium]MDW8067988.1 pyrimidine 5'-nucleotidase [Anaerolineae bacterium]
MPFTHAVFDLDETLYPTSTGLMQRVARRITDWLQRRLGLDPEEASYLRRTYIQRYGTTLAGLLAEHPGRVDVEDYLAYVHDVPVETYLQPDPALRTMLAGIPLGRVIFTNATTEHAVRVLRALGVDDLFERIVDIRALNFVHKPRPEAYERLLALLNTPGRACILVDDRAVNLQPAKRWGMTTVLINGPLQDGVDFTVASVLDVGPLVHRLLRRS